MARQGKTTAPTNISPSIQSVVPQIILNASREERLQYFKDQRFRHPIFDEAREKLIDKIIDPCGRRTIHVFGPTGAGKTTLCDLVERYFVEHQKEVSGRTGRSQLVRLDALASEGSRFGWKDFYKQGLFQLHALHPDVEVDLGVDGIRRVLNGSLVIDDRVSVFALRSAFIKFARLVKPLAFLIDEAPHIKKIASGEHVSYQMDVLKSLTDHTKVVFVLVGTYEMLDMINQNGQQGRRSRDIHMRRYQANGADMKAYLNILSTLQKRLPLLDPPNLVAMAPDLYKGSLGCVGMFMTWLYDTLDSVLKAGRGTITFEDFEKHKLEKGKLLQAAREISNGEAKLRQIEKECDEELDELLGLVPAKRVA